MFQEAYTVIILLQLIEWRANQTSVQNLHEKQKTYNMFSINEIPVGDNVDV